MNTIIDLHHELKSKIDIKKQIKKEKLLRSAYNLFTNKGLERTSIQDIASNAGVAKGTFYLYFKDKEDIRNQLILTEVQRIINEGYTSLMMNPDLTFEEEIIYIINYLIDILKDNPELINLIDRDLSLGFYSEELNKILENEFELHKHFTEGLRTLDPDREDTDILFFMIVEFVSTTCYRCIISHKPCDIDTYKPYLFAEIRHIIHLNVKGENH